MKGIAGIAALCIIGGIVGGNAFADPSGPLPPAVLYHAGPKDVLMKDIEAGNVPWDDWNKFIVGDVQSSFDLPGSRKGLYGAENIPLTSFFGSGVSGEGRPNWLIQINLKAECLVPSRVDDAEFSLGDGSRFDRWIKNHSHITDEIVDECTFKPDRGMEKWPGERHWIQASYMVHEASPEAQQRTRTCDSILENYLEDQRIAIVRDEAYGHSWYIRDRDCIQGIDGTVDQWFDRVIVEGRFFISDSDENDMHGNYSLFIQILADTSHLTPDSIPALRKFSKKLVEDIDDDYWDLQYSPEIAMEKIVDGAIRAIQAHRVKQFKKILSTHFHNLLALSSSKASEKSVTNEVERMLKEI